MSAYKQWRCTFTGKWSSCFGAALLSALAATAQTPPANGQYRQNDRVSRRPRLPGSFGPSYTEFATETAGSSPTQITLGPDGATWFVEAVANKIGRIIPAGGVREISVPTADAGLAGITLGLDGALWFTESFADKIGRITTAGVITNEFRHHGWQPTNGHCFGAGWRVVVYRVC